VTPPDGKGKGETRPNHYFVIVGEASSLYLCVLTDSGVNDERKALEMTGQKHLSVTIADHRRVETAYIYLATISIISGACR
jgi:hypothetical protein